jgi:hypothetical protein
VAEFPSEWVADLRRNQWPGWVGIRTLEGAEPINAKEYLADELKALKKGVHDDFFDELRKEIEADEGEEGEE